MKKKIIFSLFFLALLFVTIIFYNSLKIDNAFVPDQLIGKKLPNFLTASLFHSNEIISEKNITEGKYYLINIWASWCGPCREEHPVLMKLSKENSLRIIGINFKDQKNNAISFLNKFGNPYKSVGIDKDGSLSINIGAYGVPETILINKDKIIVLKFVGPLNLNNYDNILKVIKE